MTFAHVRLGVLALAGLAVGAVTAVAILPQARERLLPGRSIQTWGEARVGGPFSLIDHTGRRVTAADFKGRIMLVLFGASSSPDLTPSALQVLAAALDRLGPRADRFVPILITVDPERDTPQRLKAYVQGFHPRLVGLTGTPAEIAAVTRAYHVGGQGEEPRAPTGTLLDQPPLVYVMDADGRYLVHLNPAAGADAIAASLAKLG
ncbi:MAG: SCO family protein [Hyphomicrobiaceae bacterium]|nr:SCO family protein [Hyphomicrobiaceae bacterium]